MGGQAASWSAVVPHRAQPLPVVRRAALQVGRVPMVAWEPDCPPEPQVGSAGPRELLSAEAVCQEQELPEPLEPQAWESLVRQQALLAWVLQEQHAQAQQARREPDWAWGPQVALESKEPSARRDESPQASQRPERELGALPDAYAPLLPQLLWPPFPGAQRVPEPLLLRLDRVGACAPSRQRPRESSWSASSFPPTRTQAKGQ